jgi:hypothetical protein
LAVTAAEDSWASWLFGGLFVVLAVAANVIIFRRTEGDF